MSGYWIGWSNSQVKILKIGRKWEMRLSYFQDVSDNIEEQQDLISDKCIDGASVDILYLYWFISPAMNIFSNA